MARDAIDSSLGNWSAWMCPNQLFLHLIIGMAFHNQSKDPNQTIPSRPLKKGDIVGHLHVVLLNSPLRRYMTTCHPAWQRFGCLWAQVGDTGRMQPNSWSVSQNVGSPVSVAFNWAIMSTNWASTVSNSSTGSVGQFATSECSKKQRHLRGLHVFQFLLGNWILTASHSQEYDFSTQSPTKNSTHGTSRDKSQQFLVTVLVLVISDVVRLIQNPLLVLQNQQLQGGEKPQLGAKGMAV